MAGGPVLLRTCEAACLATVRGYEKKQLQSQASSLARASCLVLPQSWPSQEALDEIPVAGLDSCLNPDESPGLEVDGYENQIFQPPGSNEATRSPS